MTLAPRHPRLPHHVTQRGVRSLAIFMDDAGRDLYLKLMRGECARQDCSILAWCLMTNHVHLIVAPEREESLALGSEDFVKRLEARSGRRLFPRRGGWTKRSGADGRS